VRSVFASVAIVVAATACSVTNPKPLPPHRRPPPEARSDHPRPPDLPIPAEPPMVDERYLGWTLLADAAGLVPLVQWMVRPEQTYLALPSLVLPPLVHVAHGQNGKAVASLAMRGAMLAVVYAAGRSLEDGCEGELVCVPLGPLMLANAAITLTIVTDAIFFARRQRPDGTWRRLQILPTVTPQGAGVGIGGRF